MSIFVANWKEVLSRSAVVWVGLIGAFLPEVPGWILKAIDSGQADFLSPEAKNYLRMFLMVVAIPLARIWKQQKLATATERRLEQEKLVRVALEKEATSPGPAITQADVREIKNQAAEVVKE